MSEFLVPPELQSLLAGHDWIDSRTVTSRASLRSFVAAMLTYAPAWLRAAYATRSALVPLVGLKPASMIVEGLTPGAVPFENGARLGIFTVVAAREERWWAARYEDSHLFADLVVTREAGKNMDDAAIFQVASVVHFRNLLGRVYFAAVLPVHLLVFDRMAASGGRAT